MRNIVLLLGLIIIIVTVLVFLKPAPKNPLPLKSPKPLSSTVSDISQTTVIAQNLDTPWAIAFLPDNSMLITERAGRVRLIDSSGKLQLEPVAILAKVKEIGEGGLLGLTLHPEFSTNHYVYLYYTYQGSGDNTLNRVVRMVYQNNQLSNEQIIVDNIPGAANHNGGRIKFGPDKLLYITTGDAQNPSQAQDISRLAGKILRVTEDGKIAPGNPFKNLIFSFGHRNPQGITWGADGRLWETEHGPSGGSLGFGNDEVNVIYAGKNYGWPIIQGDKTQTGLETPIKNSGTLTWAPAGAAIVNDVLYFAGLKGEALYSLDIKPDVRMVVTEKKIVEHFKGQFGRIREVILGPDNMLYITTSNKDGRGNPQAGDDKMIRINPQKL